MKLKYINPKNVENLAPAWVVEPFILSKTLDRCLSRVYEQRPDLTPSSWAAPLRFWLEVSFVDENMAVSLCEPKDGEDPTHNGQVIITLQSGGALTIPLNAILKGSDKLAGSHCVYVHSILTDTPLSYVGISKHSWFKRYAQHQSSARTGSRLVFHSALREHAGVPINHRVFLSGLSSEAAFQAEEQLVDIYSLYPMGLNMIPGGHAGIRYLHKLGVHAKTAEERDSAVEDLAQRETVAGKPNPLCAARWAADQDYVNRVICGHSGRLSVEQVLLIRAQAGFDRPAEDIAESVGVDIKRVRLIAEGRLYGRVQ